MLAIFLCTAAVSEQGSLCDQQFSWTNKMFKVLSALLVGLLLQLDLAKGQPTLREYEHLFRELLLCLQATWNLIHP